ncbi:hypothetical protein [Clostridium sp. Cult1]|uniref:hypothetical protein n=1 Tax=Clostridium sp. Cult1 TaxID=2079002 RepID=UPI001F2F8BB8|nr:hypothetical protein [Clostridium sp. Cult1]MCF6464197.1 hypothetical protein [Clostridium sp. Cult1]
MSLAGFQRRRRELAKQKKLEEQSRIAEKEKREENDLTEQPTNGEKEDANTIGIDDITKAEIIEILTQKGIEHNPRDKKEVLYELMIKGE